MTRTEKREQGFLLMFESLFSNQSTTELINSSEEMFNKPVCSYAKQILKGIYNNKEQIDSMIDEHTEGWTKERISKVSLAVLNVAIYEMLFEKDVPNPVAINEAVELAKKYGTDKDPSFINGILGTISKIGAENDE